MLRRLYHAWRLYTGLHYSWHVAWHKAESRGLQNTQWRPTQVASQNKMRRTSPISLRAARSALKNDDTTGYAVRQANPQACCTLGSFRADA